MSPVSAMQGGRGAHGGSQAGQKAGQAQGHCHQSRGVFQHRGGDGQRGLQVKGESKLRKCQVTGDLLFVCMSSGGTGNWIASNDAKAVRKQCPLGRGVHPCGNLTG